MTEATGKRVGTTGEDVARNRILQEVRQWARRLGFVLTPAKSREVAALVAASEANGAEGASFLRSDQHAERVKRLRKLAVALRKDANKARQEEKTL